MLVYAHVCANTNNSLSAFTVFAEALGSPAFLQDAISSPCSIHIDAEHVPRQPVNHIRHFVYEIVARIRYDASAGQK